ncbi:MAG: hypothetical protein LBM67_05380 [Lentimicrobiaceae bacterium]|jgi:hypothetical protein|nr:hypothetical protein [Lentimicrobiaceae bacterium]
MMDFISVPIVTGIVLTAIYKLFELFARRKERLTIIEKLGEKINDPNFDGKLALSSYMQKSSYSALRISSLMSGIGLGLLVGLFISSLMNTGGYFPENEWMNREFISVTYGASVLLFGGLGLLIAFIIETSMEKKAKKE